MTVNGWIVNESGTDIEIVKGVGTDDCQYIFSDNGGSVWRIVKDDGENQVDGDFTLHDQPFSGKG